MARNEVYRGDVRRWMFEEVSARVAGKRQAFAKGSRSHLDQLQYMYVHDSTPQDVLMLLEPLLDLVWKHATLKIEYIAFRIGCASSCSMHLTLLLLLSSTASHHQWLRTDQDRSFFRSICFIIVAAGPQGGRSHHVT